MSLVMRAVHAIAYANTDKTGAGGRKKVPQMVDENGHIVCIEPVSILNGNAPLCVFVCDILNWAYSKHGHESIKA
eukprot:1137331-Pelagomonas_calceolata.AAC.2